jgi:hypothetical protein
MINALENQILRYRDFSLWVKPQNLRITKVLLVGNITIRVLLEDLA